MALSGCGDAGVPQADLHVIALGDSLSVGVQPGLGGAGRITSQGYPRQLAARLRADGRTVKLHELGCGGATSESLIQGRVECAPAGDEPYANEDPSTSQLAYATGLLSRLHGQQVVVTVDVGGNDVGRCLQGGALKSACVTEAGGRIEENLEAVIGRLRAVSPDAPVVVMDLYDPFLGLWEDHPGTRATLRDVHAAVIADVNAGIRRAAESTGARLAPVSRAMFQDAPIGDLAEASPASVEATCRYTWMCVQPPLIRDIHLRREGHKVVADAMFAVLPESYRSGR